MKYVVHYTFRPKINLAHYKQRQMNFVNEFIQHRRWKIHLFISIYLHVQCYIFIYIHMEMYVDTCIYLVFTKYLPGKL